MKAAGSSRALAKMIGVSEGTLRRWKKKLTKKGREKLTKFRKERGTAKRARAADRKAFEGLMAKAERAGKLPNPRSGEGRRSGRKTVGWRYTRAFGRNLTLSLIDEAIAWASGLQKRWPLWQALAVVSEFGAGEHKGYSTVYFQLPDPRSGDFAIEAEIATRRGTVRSEVLSQLREKLEELVESGLLVFVHAVTIFNYRLRTPEEQRSYSSRQRRERKIAWQKKQKKQKRTKAKKPKKRSKPRTSSSRSRSKRARIRRPSTRRRSRTRSKRQA